MVWTALARYIVILLFLLLYHIVLAFLLGAKLGCYQGFPYHTLSRLHSMMMYN